MIDIHTHVLPGIDDGAANITESLAMLRAMVADDIEVVVATPHVRADFPTTVAAMESALGALRAAVRSASVAIEILPGGEIAVDTVPGLSDDELHAFSLGGSSAAVLIEAPYHGWSIAVEEAVVTVATTGLTPVLAHPERNPVVQEQPGILSRLVESGMLVQLTAASLEGLLGRRALATAHRLLDSGLAHVVASDAHGPNVRRSGLGDVATTIGDPGLAEWLTAEVPQALVAGSRVLPPRPPRRRLRPRWPRTRRSANGA